MTASVGLGRCDDLFVFALDPDLSILERLAIGTMHGALDGLAECDSRKNHGPCYENSGQNSCSIKHERNSTCCEAILQSFL